MKKRPIIGISANIQQVEAGSYIGRDRAAILMDYVHAISLAGGVPILLPVISQDELILSQIESIDGLILSGGPDVSPLYYGQEPKEKLGLVRADRDLHEFALLKMAKESKKPIFAICRGMQLLNVAYGGSLFQDIAMEVPSALQYHQFALAAEPSHNVELTSDGKLKKWMGQKSLLTNSLHHQAIKDLADGLIVTGYTKDGVIEAVEEKGEDFVLGVQWHPELMISKDPNMLKLFKVFVEWA